MPLSMEMERVQGMKKKIDKNSKKKKEEEKIKLKHAGIYYHRCYSRTLAGF